MMIDKHRKRGQTKACRYCPLQLVCMVGMNITLDSLCPRCKGWVLSKQRLIVQCHLLGVPTYPAYKALLFSYNHCPNCRPGSITYNAYTIVRPWDNAREGYVFANEVSK